VFVFYEHCSTGERRSRQVSYLTMKESPFLRRAIKPQRPAKNPLGRDQIVQAALRIVKA